MLRFTLSEGCVRHALRGVPDEDVCIEPMRPGSPEVPLALALHDARPVRFARDADSFVDVCRTYAKTPWALSRGGEFLGYLVSGREKSAIAEIAAASADALQVMLKAWFVQNGLKRLEVSVPPADAVTARRMASLADGQAMGACINVRAFNPVSYTHLDVYKRQGSVYAYMYASHVALLSEIEPEPTAAPVQGEWAVVNADTYVYQSPSAFSARLSVPEGMHCLLYTSRCV